MKRDKEIRERERGELVLAGLLILVVMTIVMGTIYGSIISHRKSCFAKAMVSALRWGQQDAVVQAGMKIGASPSQERLARDALNQKLQQDVFLQSCGVNASEMISVDLGSGPEAVAFAKPGQSGHSVTGRSSFSNNSSVLEGGDIVVQATAVLKQDLVPFLGFSGLEFAVTETALWKGPASAVGNPSDTPIPNDTSVPFTPTTIPLNTATPLPETATPTATATVTETPTPTSTATIPSTVTPAAPTVTPGGPTATPGAAPTSTPAAPTPTFTPIPPPTPTTTGGCSETLTQLETYCGTVCAVDAPLVLPGESGYDALRALCISGDQNYRGSPDPGNCNGNIVNGGAAYILNPRASP